VPEFAARCDCAVEVCHGERGAAHGLESKPNSEQSEDGGMSKQDALKAGQ
jgi:hypothetical protein